MSQSPVMVIAQIGDFCGLTDARPTYKTSNPFAEGRDIYFFCDPPHLLKTARNCFFKFLFTLQGLDVVGMFIYTCISRYMYLFINPLLGMHSWALSLGIFNRLFTLYTSATVVFSSLETSKKEKSLLNNHRSTLASIATYTSIVMQTEWVKSLIGVKSLIEARSSYR